MLSKLRKIKKNGFTMVEVIFVCVVFAMLISGIILAINRSYAFLNNTRVQIRATNLTREGMEMMFNIRDTNWRKCSGLKDQFWLYLGSGASDTNEKKCDPETKIFQPGIYTIKEGRNSSGDRFVYAEKLDQLTTIAMQTGFYEDYDKFFSDTDEAYKQSREQARVIFTGNYTYRSGSVATGHQFTGNISDLLGDGVEFYRIVRVYGIYKKDNSSPTSNDSAQYGELQGSTPKEMRFCVKTFYKLGAGTHSLELCSIMTNFME